MRDEHGRVAPAYSGSEAEQALGFLDFFRGTIAWKTSELTREQLSATHPPSTMTLGGLLKHLALVEDSWISQRFLGEPEGEPWAGVDWDGDPDWEWRTAADDDPQALHALWRGAVERSRAVTTGADFDATSATTNRHGEYFTLRWVVLHMIEEYARHCGHADLIRESIDGQTGE